MLDMRTLCRAPPLHTPLTLPVAAVRLGHCLARGFPFADIAPAPALPRPVVAFVCSGWCCYLTRPAVLRGRAALPPRATIHTLAPVPFMRAHFTPFPTHIPGWLVGWLVYLQRGRFNAFTRCPLPRFFPFYLAYLRYAQQRCHQPAPPCACPNAWRWFAPCCLLCI